MLWSAIVLGFMGSLHCVGMCGPIALMLPVDRKNPAKKALQMGLYHLGRATAYALLGLVFGFVGKGLYLFGMQQRLSVFIGVLMILVALVPTRLVNRYNLSGPIARIISKIKSRLGKELQKRTPDTFLTIGFLNGFLPCGLVYMGLFGAMAMGGPWWGALFMVFFGLGTVPLMSGAVYFGSMLKGNARNTVRKWIPVFVVCMGLLFVLRGLGLGIPYVSPKEPQQTLVSAQMECH